MQHRLIPHDRAILKSGSSIVKNPSNRPPPTLAMRNLQLAVVSLPFSLVGMLFPDYDRHRILSRGVLDRFDWLAWTVVVNQAVGGLLIAAVVKHADSVAKGFATSIAVICEQLCMVGMQSPFADGQL